MTSTAKAKGKASPKPEKNGATSLSSNAEVTEEASTSPAGTRGAKGAAAAAEKPKRKLGLRSAAPWAARHAAKHAAEARARAAEPPPPGSARATIRTPTGVEEIKAQIVELHNHLERIKTLRKSLPKSFYDVGALLKSVQEQKLYAAKGFQSFEAFLEREVDLGKVVALRLTRIAGIFQKEAALEFGMERTIDALVHIEIGLEAAGLTKQSASTAAKTPTAGRLQQLALGTDGFQRKLL